MANSFKEFNFTFTVDSIKYWRRLAWNRAFVVKLISVTLRVDDHFGHFVCHTSKHLHMNNILKLYADSSQLKSAIMIYTQSTLIVYNAIFIDCICSRKPNFRHLIYFTTWDLTVYLHVRECKINGI